MAAPVVPEFLALPLREAAAAALTAATQAGASHADVRIERRQPASLGVKA